MGHYSVGPADATQDFTSDQLTELRKAGLRDVFLYRLRAVGESEQLQPYVVVEASDGEQAKAKVAKVLGMKPEQFVVLRADTDAPRPRRP